MVADYEFVPVPVRVGLLPRVLRLLAEYEDSLAAQKGPAAEPASPRAPEGGTEPPERGSGLRANQGRVWSSEEYNLLVNENTVSAGRVRQIMDAMLIHGAPRGRVSTSQLAAETGLRDTQIRAALSWLTRFLRANGEQFENDQWPFGWAVGRQVDPENPNEFHYEMTPDQAAGWLMHLSADPDPDTIVDDTGEGGEERGGDGRP